MIDLFVESVLFYLVIAVLIFIVLREFWCWYWKINARKRLLESLIEKQVEITAELKKMNQTLEKLCEYRLFEKDEVTTKLSKAAMDMFDSEYKTRKKSPSTDVPVVPAESPSDEPPDSDPENKPNQPQKPFSHDYRPKTKELEALIETRKAGRQCVYCGKDLTADHPDYFCGEEHKEKYWEGTVITLINSGNTEHS